MHYGLFWALQVELFLDDVKLRQELPIRIMSIIFGYDVRKKPMLLFEDFSKQSH